MNAMTHFAKMLALMPVVALAAACGNSASPGGATSVPSGIAAEDSVTASSATFAQPCTVSSVSLRTDDQSSRSMIWVEARYAPAQPSSLSCNAPVWSADRKGLMVDSANAYRAGYPRSLAGVVNITAVAPNGVRNSIRVDLGGVSLSALPTTARDVCQTIENVTLRRVDDRLARGTVRFLAIYDYANQPFAACTVAPRWTASRSGLVVEADGFHASIAATGTGTANLPTTITATAPNGVTRSVRF